MLTHIAHEVEDTAALRGARAARIADGLSLAGHSTLAGQIRQCRIYRDALAAAPNPGDLIALGNIARVRGDDAAAAQAYREAEAMIATSVESRRAHARTWANHLLDNGGNASLALEIAAEELETRTDTAGWETYAWALFKNGRIAEAREAIDVALDRGLDAHGYYRAGAISAALGETDRAVDELTVALDLSPRFHPIDADQAAELLAELSR